MARGDGSAARAYHEGTKHSPQSVRSRFHYMDWDNRPDPFKSYRDDLETVALPEPASAGVRSLDAVAAVDAPGPAAGPDLAGLARLLRLGAGVLRRRAFGGDEYFFRTYASAGALYPVEVYAVSGDLDGLAAGVYHFHPREMSLRRLREGDHRGHLARAASGEPAVASAPVVLALTGIPWRTAWKYAERGYRHLFWDAGMILANVLALASSAGLPSRVVMGFADAEVEALLGLDAREFPLCLVPVGTGRPVEPAPGPPEALRLRARGPTRREAEFEGIRVVNDAGRLDGPDQATAWRESAPAMPGPEGGGAVRPEPPVRSGDELETVIRRRGSARAFGPRPIPAGVLADVLDRAARGVPTDLAPSGSRLVEPYLVASGLKGLPPGAYAWRDGFVLLREGDFRREAGFLCLEQRLGADAAATHFLMADLDRALGALGDRGYRAAQLEAGIVAGKVYLGAYAYRYGATGLTFYDDAVTAFFSPEAAGASCMLVVTVGQSASRRLLPLA